MFKESLMPEGGAEIMGVCSHGFKVDLGNNKEMIFVTGQIAQDSNGNVKQEIDGIFQVYLNNEGKYTYFK